VHRDAKTNQVRGAAVLLACQVVIVGSERMFMKWPEIIAQSSAVRQQAL
jgi:hypothetical protein